MSLFLWLFVLAAGRLAPASAACGAIAPTLTGDTSLTWAWLVCRRGPSRGSAVSEQASVDSRRKLLLIRRDDVEHLIMTGGPVDVVIETNIASSAEASRRARAGRARAEREPAAPVFTRTPRSFGQAVNE